MSTVSELIAEIEGFCHEADITEGAFGSRVLNDSKFVGRLRSGSGLTLKTLEKIRAYITEQRRLMDAGQVARKAAAPGPRQDAA